MGHYVPTPVSTQVDAAVESRGAYRWLERHATGGDAHWVTEAGTLYLRTPPSLALGRTSIRGAIEFALAPGREVPERADEAARLMLDALGELPDADLLLRGGLDLRVAIRLRDGRLA